MEKNNRKNTSGFVAESATRSVVAAVFFVDALTGRSYSAGDVVVGWDDSRVDEYCKRGLVYRVSRIGPTEVK